MARMEKIVKKCRNICFLTILMVLHLNITSIYAYDQPQELNRINTCSNFDNEKFIDTNLKEHTDDVRLDGYFVGETGKKCGSKWVHLRACMHIYVNGTYTNHVKNGNGCVNDRYDAKRCSNCGHLLIEEFRNKMTYQVCFHKESSVH